MKNGYKSIILILLAFGCALFLSGCDNMVVFHPKGAVALEERNLIIIAVLLMLIVVIPVILLTFIFAWKYRASNTKATYTPEWHHSTTLEFVWWGVPIIICSILGTIIWETSHSLDPYRPLTSDIKPVDIEAVALDWKWLFIYPDQNIATVNYIQLPVNTPVNFRITSDAPMNSLWIPALAGQIYAMSGMQTQLHMIANQTGEYKGLSSNFSGPGFSGMQFIVKVTDENDFDQWVNMVKGQPNSLNDAIYTELAKPSENNPVAYYSSVQGDLFKMIMMKYMMPMTSSSSMGQNSMPMMQTQ